MKLRIASDLHTEFMDWVRERLGCSPFELCLPFHEDDYETTLVLAGDCAGSSNKRSSLDFNSHEFEYLCRRFKHVVVIDGNHEHYGREFHSLRDQQREAAKQFDNLHYLQEDVVELDGQRFVGCTLWSDVPYEYSWAVDRMSDYRYVKLRQVGRQFDHGPEHKRYRKLRVVDTVKEHYRHVDWLRETIQEGDVVVTHHGPSYGSLHPMYANETAMNTGYLTHLDWLLEEKKPKLWVHGHVHNNFDYQVGDTRVVVNPRGYQGVGSVPENHHYKDAFFVDV